RGAEGRAEALRARPGAAPGRDRRRHRQGQGRRRPRGGTRRGGGAAAEGRRGGGVQRARGRLAHTGADPAAVPGALGWPAAAVHAGRRRRRAVSPDPDTRRGAAMTMGVVAAEVEAALRARAHDYLRDNGTLAPTAAIRRRVTQAFDNLEKFLRGAEPRHAARRAWPAEWSLHEIADHVVQTHRPSRDELRELLTGRRPAGPPIPASLQSPEPLGRPWAAALDALGRVHADLRAPVRTPALGALAVGFQNAAAHVGVERGRFHPERARGVVAGQVFLAVHHDRRHGGLHATSRLAVRSSPANLTQV